MTVEPTTRCDLAVIGGGIAGLYAALCVGEEADVLLLSKGPLRSSASYLAQGGVAAADRCRRQPRAARGGHDARGPRPVPRERRPGARRRKRPHAWPTSRELGVPFDPEPGLEGGHSRRRVLHVAGAATGKEILRVLVDRVLEHPRIRVSEGETVRAISAETAVGLVTRSAVDRGAGNARRHGRRGVALGADDESARRHR